MKGEGTLTHTEDVFFMTKALKLAKQAEKEGEVPVGAVIVQDTKKKLVVLASTFNKKEQWQKTTAHAEILAIELANLKLKSWRLNDCTLYVTLEPCPMCAGALVQARIKRLVYACSDPKAGAVHSLYQLTTDPKLNHRVEVKAGVLQKECSQLLKTFFKTRRDRL